MISNLGSTGGNNNQTNPTQVIEHLFGYTGRMFDNEIGLQNNLNRWYDPVVGRWISKDPIGFEAGDANLYRYVGNQATAATDPSGLFGNWGGTVVPDAGGFGGKRYVPGFTMPRRPTPPSFTLDELELSFAFLPGGIQFVEDLRLIRDIIHENGGIRRRRWFWQNDGFLCDEADELVMDILRKGRRNGWKYEHDEYTGWFMDHNWGVVRGPGGIAVTVDFWGDRIYGDGEHPVSAGPDNPYNFVSDF